VVPGGTAGDLYENAPCGYLSTDPGGLITRVNQTFLAWTGHRREDLVGRRRFQDLLSPGGRIFHDTHFAALLELRGSVREIALDIVRADRQRLPVLVNAVRDRDAGGTTGDRIVVFDATVRRQYERELLARRRAAESSEARVRALQRLTAALAAALDVAQIAAVVLEQLAAVLAVDAAVLALVDEDTGGLVEIGGTVPARDSVAAVALDRRGAVFTGPLPDDARAPTGPPDPGAAAAPAGAAALPLVVDGRMLGVLRLDFPAGRQLAAEERELLETFAAQCAQAVRRTLLHAETLDAGRRSALLADVSRALNEGLDVGVRTRRLTELLVPTLADRAIVDLVRGTDLVRVAATPPARADDDTGVPSSLALRALTTGEPELGPDDRPRHLGASRAVALPLRSRGHVIGALTLTSDRRYRARDLPFLTDLADRAALALENVVLYEEVRAVAHTLQLSMLAGSPPDDPRFEVASFYRPAVANLEVGGDWYDTFAVRDGVVGIVVGDVVGRGIVAATAMGQLRSAVRALAGTGLGPAGLLRHLDRYAENVEAAGMATVVYGELTPATGRLRYASAGHLPPLVLPPGGAPELLWDGRGTPLGVFPGLPERADAETTLAPGTRLLLYTDGLVERRARSILSGLDRLAAEVAARAVLPPAALVEDLTRAMLADEDRPDDVCLLCLGYAGP
jgi:serine/threonine-protein kinase RsbW